MLLWNGLEGVLQSSESYKLQFKTYRNLNFDNSASNSGIGPDNSLPERSLKQMNIIYMIKFLCLSSDPNQIAILTRTLTV